MQKVLIANPNVEQRIRLCQQLANDKRLEVIETADGKTALEKYLSIFSVSQGSSSIQK